MAAPLTGAIVLQRQNRDSPKPLLQWLTLDQTQTHTNPARCAPCDRKSSLLQKVGLARPSLRWVQEILQLGVEQMGTEQGHCRAAPWGPRQSRRSFRTSSLPPTPTSSSPLLTLITPVMGLRHRRAGSLLLGSKWLMVGRAGVRGLEAGPFQ